MKEKEQDFCGSNCYRYCNCCCCCCRLEEREAVDVNEIVGGAFASGLVLERHPVEACSVCCSMGAGMVPYHIVVRIAVAVVSAANSFEVKERRAENFAVHVAVHIVVHVIVAVAAVDTAAVAMRRFLVGNRKCRCESMDGDCVAAVAAAPADRIGL